VGTCPHQVVAEFSKESEFNFFSICSSKAMIDWNFESFTKLILMKTFWDLSCTHFHPFLKLRKTLRGQFSIWRYCWLLRTLCSKSSIRCCKSCEAYFGVSGFKSRVLWLAKTTVPIYITWKCIIPEKNLKPF
jgi:hypothetical protein